MLQSCPRTWLQNGVTSLSVRGVLPDARAFTSCDRIRVLEKRGGGRVTALNGVIVAAAVALGALFAFGSDRVLFHAVAARLKCRVLHELRVHRQSLSEWESAPADALPARLAEAWRGHGPCRLRR